MSPSHTEHADQRARALPSPDWVSTDGEAYLRWNVERLQTFLSGLRLRLGYWPTTSFNDPSASLINWQRRFEASSADKMGFATFVHCLLDGAAEYPWLDTP